MDGDRYSDGNSRALKQLWIIFKTLSIQFAPSSEYKSFEAVGLSTTEEDLMDVLCLTQPNNPCIMPAPIEELRPHAKRILNFSAPYECSFIPREDFRGLLKLLLCIEMDKPDFSLRGNIATHAPPIIDKDLLDRIAEALLKNFTLNEKGDIHWHDFSNVINTYLVKFSPFHEHITALLTFEYTAEFFPSISASLHHLPFSVQFNRGISRRILTETYASTRLCTIPLPNFTPASGRSPTLARRAQPPQGTVRSPKHSSNILGITR